MRVQRVESGRRAGSARRRVWTAVAALASAGVLVALGLVAVPVASGATGLNVFVGYMDTHTVGSSAEAASPWPYTDPTSYVGSPCPSYPTSTTCWDASALRLDNPGSVDVTGVHPVVGSAPARTTCGGRT